MGNLVNRTGVRNELRALGGQLSDEAVELLEEYLHQKVHQAEAFALDIGQRRVTVAIMRRALENGTE